MDKRANNGGRRENSGRLKKNEVISMVEQMDKRLIPETLWDSLAKLVESNDIQAIKTWLGYRYGMPKQTIDNKNEIIIDRPIEITEAQFKQALEAIKPK